MLRKRVEAVLDMAVTTISSLTESFQSGASLLEEDAAVGKDMDQQDDLSNMPADSGRSTLPESILLHAETSKSTAMDVEG